MPAVTDSSAEVFVQADTLSTKLVTTPMLEEFVPSLGVSWIAWDSGFRGSGLRVADRIVAVDGTPITRPKDATETQRTRPGLIGQYNERATWKERGAKEGDAVTLTVRRRRVPGEGWEELEVKGELRPDKTYVNSTGRQLIGHGGPERMANDGLSGAWGPWHEEAMVKAWSRVLDDGLWRGSLSTEYELRQHLEHEARVKMLVERYPGPFADAVREDWEQVRQTLLGRVYEVGAEALAYRQFGEQRVAEVKETGRTARAAFLAAHSAELIPVFPSIDPVLGNRAGVTNKLVELPRITQREWISQGPRTYFSWNEGNYWYFVEGEGRGMQQVLIAHRRYEKMVTPNIRSEYEVIGRITGDPVLVSVQGTGRFGLKVEPAAVSIGAAFFIDVSPERGEKPLFAGEEKLLAPNLNVPPDDASPRAVMESFYEALKMGEQPLWKEHYGSISLRMAPNGVPVVNVSRPQNMDSVWESARRLILDRICDVRVLWVDEPRIVVSGKEFEGAPLIEEVDIEVEHIRKLEDGTFRAYSVVGIHRPWTLQRLNGGPWRIANTVQGI